MKVERDNPNDGTKILRGLTAGDVFSFGNNIYVRNNWAQGAPKISVTWLDGNMHHPHLGLDPEERVISYPNAKLLLGQPGE